LTEPICPACRVTRAGVKSRKVTERVIRTTAGTRVTLEDRKALDEPATVTAIRQALDLAVSEPGDDQAAA
jgi:hypothetical protein